MAYTKAYLKNQTIKAMKDLGIYKKEYNQLIDIYAGLLHQYKSFEAEFIKSGYQVEEEYTNKAGATNMRKVPLYTAMETLRKDIATYSDKLALNPKAYESITVEVAQQSTLEKALLKFG